MLDDSLKSALRDHLGKLREPIVLVANLDESETAGQMRDLLTQIASLSSMITLREQPDSAVRAPSFQVTRPDADVGVRFAGLPLGHEFTSLVLALLQVGGHPPRLDAATIEQIRALDADLNFETFVSLECHNCPDVVQALNLMAVLNPRIRHTMIEGGAFQDEVRRRAILSVPQILLNGEPFGSGRQSLEEILGRIDTQAGHRRAQALADKPVYDVLIVGGGPAGTAAAIYSARKGLRTGLVAERLGGQVLDTMGIENFISVPSTEGPKLAQALQSHVQHYEVDLITQQHAARLIKGPTLGVALESGATLNARSVIVATGARWRELGVPGEQQYRNRGVAYCPHCDGPLFKGKRVAVIGGGNSGVEAAIDLAGIVGHVTLLEFASSLRADAVLQRALAKLSNVTVITRAQTTAITGDEHRVSGLAYVDRSSGQPQALALEGVFVQIGLVPNTAWLDGTIALTRSGEIPIDAAGRTALPGVFAAGDCTTVPYKQIVIATGEGSKAALSAFEYLVLGEDAAHPEALPKAA